jgi:radical SAM protein with 4Fe4S-binding SPASM domain
MAEWEIFARQFLGPDQPRGPADDLYQCGGGVNAFAVDPDGGMSICVLSQSDKFSLRTGSVREGWGGFLRKVRAKQATRVTKCTACRLKSLCGMCPANGELENADPEAPVDFLCRVAHLRAYTFGFEVPAHGDCECCPSGHAHDEVMAAARRLEAVGPGSALAPRKSRGLPMAKASATAKADGCGGGCASCR